MSDNDQMLEIFLFEMSSLLEQLDEILLTSEQAQTLTEDHVNEIFRIMHTIKGSSAMMEFNVISTVTHRLEDTFYVIRENGLPDDHFTQLFDLMLDASDFLKSQLEAIQNGEELATGNDELVARVVGFLSDDSKAEPKAPAAQPVPLAPPTATPVDSAPTADAPVRVPSLAKGAQAFHVDVLFEEDCGMENLRAFMLVTSLGEKCKIVNYEPSDIEYNPESASEILVNGFSILLETDLSQEELQAIVEKSMHVKNAAITPVDSVPEVSSAVKGGNRYQAFVLFEEDCGMENLRAFMLINSLRQECNILKFTPEDIESNSQTAGMIMADGFTIELETNLSQSDLQKSIQDSMHVRSVKVTLLEKEAAAPAYSDMEPVVPATTTAPPAPQPQAPPPAPAAPDPVAEAAQAVKTEQAKAPLKAAPVPATNKPIKQNLINVSLSKLDELMDLMGELVITESMVIHSPDLKGMGGKLDNFNKSARQLLKLTDELQDMVMSVRMIPVSGTFQKMQRIVRDMCRNLGKDAHLVTMGEETDIDKTIIDGIADPIMHLVRNAMDHAIEHPDERAAVGKNPKGTITLSAQNTGGEILITVSDDGKGLDAEAILNKAKNQGILTKPVGEYTDKEAFMLLCMPGFSTKEQVTEYSGRGVGMDVVKKNIEKIGGTVVIESRKGYGTSVFLKIPLTLAIVDGMDISAGDSIYTLQITSINESFKATKDQLIIDTRGNEMIMIRGQVFPVIRLHELYDIPDAITDIEEGILIWVESGDRSACLFVDQLIGEQQIVVKPLPLYLKRYDIKSYGISGCTILGDGNISLILDVGSIIEKAMD